MDKRKQAYIMFHTVEEGKNMDREKLNMVLHKVFFKRTLADDIITLIICGITIAMLVVALGKFLN